MKAFLRIDLAHSLLKQLRRLSKEERKELGILIEKTRSSFGNPHQHAGIGIRKLSEPVYECRYRLGLRLVFSWTDHGLYFHFLGNHDQVRQFLKKI